MYIIVIAIAAVVLILGALAASIIVTGRLDDERDATTAHTEGECLDVASDVTHGLADLDVA